MRMILLLLISISACGPDTSGAGTTGQTLDAGKKVARCSECASTEYCMIVGKSTESYYCATDACSGECSCLMPEAAKRHAECSSSCQTGSKIVYCAK